MARSGDDAYWRELESHAHLPEVQELIRQEVQKGTIRVRPNPDGSIRIDGDEGWRESRSLPLVHVPSVHVSKQPRGDIRGVWRIAAVRARAMGTVTHQLSTRSALREGDRSGALRRVHGVTGHRARHGSVDRAAFSIRRYL